MSVHVKIMVGTALSMTHHLLLVHGSLLLWSVSTRYLRRSCSTHEARFLCVGLTAFRSDLLYLLLGAVGEVAGVLVVGHDDWKLENGRSLDVVSVLVIAMNGFTANARWPTYGILSSLNTVVMMPYP